MFNFIQLSALKFLPAGYRGSFFTETGERWSECSDGVCRDSLRIEGREGLRERCDKVEVDGDAGTTGGGAAASLSLRYSQSDPLFTILPYAEVSGRGMKLERTMLGELATLALGERGVESPRRDW